VTGNPTPDVAWLIEGQKIHPEDCDAKLENGVATLFLEDAMQEDSGKYECVASNVEGEVRCTCKVEVLGECCLPYTYCTIW